MHLPTILTTLTTLALTTSVAPTTTPSQFHPTTNNINNNNNIPKTKRTCAGTQYPVLRANPSQALPYTLAIASGQSTEVGFTIPEDAVGPCSLVVSLPTGAAQITGSGVQVNVIALDGPTPGALVGTTTFGGGGGGAVGATINSFACRAQMCYGLEIASDDGQGGKSVAFVEAAGEGISMTYDC
ncbi:hypothetical protein B0T17DRAFT_566781 [Bombardia bombarda]|uniref:Ubiquitin 3 binding protein But2 C-terminal domain-containing protein n=1 Tax=Bombardia bombarda TaxID=252184 RepID=A0AA39XHY5_9PEZI|nr:hypothetical protein B0T17DRAFT_566781 [Bombardia bombarda]